VVKGGKRENISIKPIHSNQGEAGMKKQIIRVSPVQTAKVAALMYFLLSIPMVAFMVLSFSFAPMPGPRFGFGFMILFPLLYLVFGFVFTVIAAWVYNLAAGWVGGVEYTSITVDSPD
jgi:hypothetical protein